jgi:hypothetical protein
MNPFKIFGWLWRKKGYLFLVTNLIIVFFLWLFPLNDLRDFATIKVYEQTGQKVFVLFNSVHIGLFPPQLSFEEVKISTPQLGSTLETKIFKIIPYSDLFIKQLPAGEVQLEGFFSSQTQASIKPGKTLENGSRLHKITLTSDHLNLKELSDKLKLPVKPAGITHLSLQGEIDPSFSLQPDFDFDFSIKNLELPPSQIETLLGPLNLPPMKIGEAKGKGRWSAGKIQIESLQFGKLTQDISGTVKGFVNLSLQNLGGQIRPEISSYQFDIDLIINQSIEPQLGLLLSLLDSYKSKTPEGHSRYRFKSSGQNFYAPPQFGPHSNK